MPAVMKPAKVARELKSVTNAQDHHDHDQESGHHPAQDQELPAAARLLHVPEGDPAPGLGQGQDQPEHHQDHRDPAEHGPQHPSRGALDQVPPPLQVGLAVVQQQGLLAERQQGAGEPLEPVGEGALGLDLCLDLGRAPVRRQRPVGLRLAFLDGAPEGIAQRGAGLLHPDPEPVGPLQEVLDLPFRGHAVVQARHLAEQAARTGERGPGRAGAGRRRGRLGRVRPLAERLGDRPGQLVDGTREVAGGPAILRRERLHLPDGVQERLLEVQLAPGPRHLGLQVGPASAGEAGELRLQGRDLGLEVLHLGGGARLRLGPALGPVVPAGPGPGVLLGLDQHGPGPGGLERQLHHLGGQALGLVLVEHLAGQSQHLDVGGDVAVPGDHRVQMAQEVLAVQRHRRRAGLNRRAGRGGRRRRRSRGRARGRGRLRRLGPGRGGAPQAGGEPQALQQGFGGSAGNRKRVGSHGSLQRRVAEDLPFPRCQRCPPAAPRACRFFHRHF